jgi:hypothetical protein
LYVGRSLSAFFGLWLSGGVRTKNVRTKFRTNLAAPMDKIQLIRIHLQEILKNIIVNNKHSWQQLKHF